MRNDAFRHRWGEKRFSLISCREAFALQPIVHVLMLHALLYSVYPAMHGKAFWQREWQVEGSC
jgi:hypothetical protein